MGLSKRVKKTIIIPVVLIVALPIGLWMVDTLTPSAARRALPATATDVQEYYSGGGVPGDYLRCLRAKMPPTDMPLFAAKLGLVRRYDTSRDAKLPLSFSADPGVSWWHQPETLSGAYFKYTPGRESFSVATYQNGRVYFLATAW